MGFRVFIRGRHVLCVAGIAVLRVLPLEPQYSSLSFHTCINYLNIFKYVTVMSIQALLSRDLTSFIKSSINFAECRPSPVNEQVNALPETLKIYSFLKMSSAILTRLTCLALYVPSNSTQMLNRSCL